VLTTPLLLHTRGVTSSIPTSARPSQITIAVVSCEPLMLSLLCEQIREQEDLLIVDQATMEPGTVDLGRVQEMLDRHHPDVLVIDGQFAGPDAETLVRQVREGPESTAHTAMVFLTTTNDSAGQNRVLRRGEAGFVLKMAPVGELLQAVRWTARGSLWVSPSLLPSLLQMSEVGSNPPLRVPNVARSYLNHQVNSQK
jgi:DNA-binding NarL/FixJ family response regulator